MTTSQSKQHLDHHKKRSQFASRYVNHIRHLNIFQKRNLNAFKMQEPSSLEKNAVQALRNDSQTQDKRNCAPLSALFEENQLQLATFFIRKI